MKIGIDISQIVYKGTGVSRFTQGLVKSILDYDKKNEWFFFFSSLRNNLDSNLEKNILENGHILIKWKLPPTTLSFLFNNFHNFSKILTFNFKFLTFLDWFITSDWTEPPLNIKKATIIHDLVYLRYPETVDSKILMTQKKRLSWVKNESQIIFVDSHATKQDLVDLLKIDSDKIYVNYPGVELKKPTKERVDLTLKKHNLNHPFILTVGKLEPRKNIKKLIEAYKKINSKNIDLVIVGPEGWDISLYRYNDIEQNVRFLGYVSDIELYALYATCLFFILPSIWEGFGYPVIEAMSLGVPVATSNTSSLKEIADDATLLFNPFDVNELYRCIDTMIRDSKLRTKLAKKGKERSKMFTWKNYYINLIAVLEKNL